MGKDRSTRGRGTASILPNGGAFGWRSALALRFHTQEELRGFSRKAFSFALLSIAILTLLGADSGPARVNDLGHRMMCVCGCNQILLECNHVGCSYSDRMRGELIAAVDRGENDDMTLQWFIQKYGTTVIAAPTDKGFNRVAWIVPYLVLVLGIVLTAFIVRAWKSRPLLAHAGVPQPAPRADIDRLREQARRETDL